MKHWHRCDRWTRRGIPCPFQGVEGTTEVPSPDPQGRDDDDQDSRDDDDEHEPPPFPLPITPPLPILPPAKEAEVKVEAQRHRGTEIGCNLIPCAFDIPEPEKNGPAEPVLPARVPAQNISGQTREDFGVPRDPPPVDRVVKQMRLNKQEGRRVSQNISGKTREDFPEAEDSRAEEVAAQFFEAQQNAARETFQPIEARPGGREGQRRQTLKAAKAHQKAIRKGVSGKGVSKPFPKGGPPRFFNAAGRMHQLIGRGVPRIRPRVGQNIAGRQRRGGL